MQTTRLRNMLVLAATDSLIGKINMLNCRPLNWVLYWDDQSTQTILDPSIGIVDQHKLFLTILAATDPSTEKHMCIGRRRPLHWDDQHLLVATGPSIGMINMF